MPQIRTITPFLAAVPDIDDRLLRDVGLDAEGNVVDEHDPRVVRLGNGHWRRFVVQRLMVLLSLARHRAAG